MRLRLPLLAALLCAAVGAPKCDLCDEEARYSDGVGLNLCGNGDHR